MSTQSVPHTFIAESRELLRAMEAALLTLEHSPGEAEAINAVFRAVHTIKGSSGMYGFDPIVEFTHALESVMVSVRYASVKVDGDLIALLLACGDQVAAMIDCLDSDDWSARLAQLGAASGELLAQLECYSPAGDADRQSPAPGAENHAGSEADSRWHISVRFSRDVLRHGMDPLSLLRYLSTLGEVAGVATLFDAMPQAAEMDPEACYIGLEIQFWGQVDRAELEAAFEFVRDDSVIHILGPDCGDADYMALIDALPEDKGRLTEALVSCGAITSDGLLDRGNGAPDPLLPGAALTTLQEQTPAPTKSEPGPTLPEAPERKTGDGRFIRVDAGKLDELINLVGELVIASASVNLGAKRTGESEMLEAAANLDRLVEEVRDGALSLRMVPIGETFSRFHRVVHDLGRTLGKDVELVITGAETELDKSMVEKINDPLIHLVRNALDHGIEPAERRLQQGKPPRGRLALNAYHETGNIVIEVADDGAGLDREKILRKAVEQGMVTADQILSDHEVFQLVMEPGFSTAEQISSVSGRGIGMDVVQRNIEAMRGSVSIASVPGKGTTMALRVPLTLAIIDGFLVGVGKAAYVVPLEMVVECMERPVDHPRDTGYLNLRGDVLPLLRLRDVFEINGAQARRENIVVVQCGGQKAGLLVDSLMGEFQTVIKPLGKLFERLAGISGSTILGTGEVALILDVQALVQRAVDAEPRAQSRHIQI
jgi:two-component system, chemotaxis family, sensor kinase CheA